MANVPRGPVLIQSVQTRLFVGRSEREDHSLNPKPIITLYPGTQAPQFIIEQIGPDRYRILTAGPYNCAPTAAIDNKVFALLLPESPYPTEWILTPHPSGEPFWFIISTPEGKVWTAQPDKPEAQIILQPRRPLPDPYSFFQIYPALRD